MPMTNAKDTLPGHIHVTMLQLCGLRTIDGDRLVTYALILLAHICLAFIISMFVGGVVRCLRSENGCEVQVLAECIGLLGVYARFLIMFARRQKIAGILAQGEKLWAEIEEGERDVVRSFVERSVRLTSLYIVANGSMVIFYAIVSQVPIISPTQPNATFIRSLPYTFYMDVPPTSPWYNALVVTQLSTMINVCISCCGVDTAAPYFVMIACGHLRSLCDRLRRLEDNIGEKCVDGSKKIIECVVYHQKIIRFCEDVEKLTDLLFMMQLVSTTYNMSLIGLKLVGDDPDKFKYLSVLSLLMTQLFICQWAPEVLLTESGALASSAYFVPLSGHDDKKIAKLIHIVTLRSQRPIQLRAGGFVNLSMECFGSMITSAVSFFTILRSIN